MTPKQQQAQSRADAVRKMAGTMPIADIAEKLHISVSTVSNIAFRNGISIGFKHRAWTTAENNRLINLGDMQVDWQTVGGLLNRTPDACRVRYGRLTREQLQG